MQMRAGPEVTGFLEGPLRGRKKALATKGQQHRYSLTPGWMVCLGIRTEWDEVGYPQLPVGPAVGCKAPASIGAEADCSAVPRLGAPSTARAGGLDTC